MIYKINQFYSTIPGFTRNFETTKSPPFYHSIGRWRIWFLIIWSIVLQVSVAYGQVECSSITFSVQSTSNCCYRLVANNRSDVCFKDFRVQLPDGTFENFVPDNNWNATSSGSNEYLLSPKMGNKAPFGQFILGTFCVRGPSPQNLVLLYDNTCLQKACEAILSLKSCPYKGSIQGIKYLDIGCEGKKYTNQPVIKDWEFSLCDQNGIEIQTSITDAQGVYAFTDLGPGTYTVKEKSKSGWKFSVPSNGQQNVNLGLDENKGPYYFGNCPTMCSCDSIYTDLVKDESSKIASYLLIIDNRNGYCFTELIVENLTGNISKVNLLLNDWKVTTLSQNTIKLSGPTSTILSGLFIPANFQFTNNLPDKISIKITIPFKKMNITQDCINEIELLLKVVPPEQCCPIEMVESGPELLINGGFSDSSPGIGYMSDYKYVLTPLQQGQYFIANASQVNSINFNWFCLPISGDLNNDYFMVVNGANDNAKIVYQQDVSIIESGIYRFCAYFNNLTIPGRNLSLPTVQLIIDNNILDFETLQEKPDKWYLLFGSINLQPGVHTVKVKCNTTNIQGNDFALDNLSLKKCVSACYAYIIVKDNGCGKFSFTAVAIGSGPFEYNWDFGDGAAGSGESVLHQYSSKGLRTVSLTVKDKNNCTTSSTVVINPIIP